jgi:hypothetical protein
MSNERRSIAADVLTYFVGLFLVVLVALVVGAVWLSVRG